MNDRKPVAVITGASGGIGLDLAKLFARDGYDLALIARNEDSLRNLATELSAEFGATSRILCKDLAVPGAAGEIYSELKSWDRSVTALVNNAGFGIYGFFFDQGPDEIGELLQVNMMALTQLTRFLLPDMVRNGKGRILNVASTAAFQPGPLMATYYASKAYVLSFSEALANELEGSGVTVTTLCPGPTQTGFQKRAYREASRLAKGKAGRMMRSEDVARAGYEGMLQAKTVVIPGRMNRILALAARFGPRNLVIRIARALQEKS